MMKLVGFAGAALLATLGAWGESLSFEPLTWEKRQVGAKGVEWEARKIINWKETNGVLRTTFVVPPGHERERWVFEAERCAGNFSASVNGKKVGEFTSPIARIHLGNVVAGTNTLEVFCEHGFDHMTEITPDTNRYRTQRLQRHRKRRKDDSWSRLGFYGTERIVEIASPADIRFTWAETSFRQKKITIKSKIDATEDVEGTLECAIADEDGREALRFSKPFTFKKGLQRVEMESPWANPKLWDVDRPNLYWATMKLVAKDGRVIDVAKPFRFGFREVWVDGRDVMFNGHPFHWRMKLWWSEMRPENHGFYQYMGFNSYYFQPNPSWWWAGMAETPPLHYAEYDMCDEKGVITNLSLPDIGYSDELLDLSLHASYEKNLADWLEPYRNHPSIIALSIGMCCYNSTEAIVPGQLGIREKERDPNDQRWGHQVNEMRAGVICKKVDPTRLAYAHGGGNLGDFAGGNCYPNMTPVQEVEDYPHHWAKHGDMPWFAAEYGFYDGSYCKDMSMLLTEYAAINFGEDAYNRETLEQLEKTIEFGIKGRLHAGIMNTEVAESSSLYYDMSRLYTYATEKYWRAFGIFGWSTFCVRYGEGLDYKGWKKKMYESDDPPEWATPRVEMHRKYMQELCAFIGGEKDFAEKNHAFYEGEEVRKNVVCVWDAAEDAKAEVLWNVKTESGSTVTNGRARVVIPAGRVVQVPIAFTVPKSHQGKRTKYVISMIAQTLRHTMGDQFTIEAFPRETTQVKAEGKAKVYFYDPKGKSAWVRDRVPGAQVVAEGVRLDPGDVLIVGREALSNAAPLPYRMEDVAKGARVVILEQSPVLWEAYGFRLVDMVTRYVYETPYSKEVMQGMRPEDLLNWRDTPTLLPEYAHVRTVVQPPKGVNRHGVASTVFEIPEATGFEPLFQCEFDLRYSPLLRLRSGKGAVYYSSFDFTGRVGEDPAATKLAENLLTLAMKPTAPTGTVVLVNDGTLDPKTDEVLAKGGVVLNVALDAAALKARGVGFATNRLYRAKLDGQLAMVATRNMFRWRDYLDVNCITEPGAECEGIWYKRGNEYFLQIGSRLLENRYPDEKKTRVARHATMPTVLALDLLRSRVLTMLGVGPSEAVCARLDTVMNKLPYEVAREWYAYGPFTFTNAEDVAKFDRTLPGEQQAIAGDMNPNPTYQMPRGIGLDAATEGKTYDFRRMLLVKDDDCLNLTRDMNLGTNGGFVYLTHLFASKEEGNLEFGFTIPSKGALYLNGEKVFDASFVGYAPGVPEMKPGALASRFKVKKGENALTLKLAVLPGGWIDWDQRVGVTLEVKGVSADDLPKVDRNVKLYSEKGNIGYAYRYVYW